MPSPAAALCIVTFNSSRFIRQCLHHVFAHSLSNLEVVILDNASTDGTPAILREYEDRARVIYNRRNNGFAGGQNQAIRATTASWVLTLNPDVRLSPTFLSEAIAAGEKDKAIGTVCGKLLSMQADFEIPTDPHFDSTGIFFTPNMRHLDRGSQQPDHGQYNRPEYVFGATGAAALYRRAMIDDVACNGEFFDEDFFAYREDADLAWRAQWLGWRCLYTPAAVAWHVRHVLPANRESVPAVLNMHSVKNRFLMRIKNGTLALYGRFGWAITIRDAAVVASCLLREHSSLRAFPLIAKALLRTLRKRRDLMRRRRVTNAYVVSWFSYTPVSFPAALPALFPEKMRR